MAALRFLYITQTIGFQKDSLPHLGEAAPGSQILDGFFLREKWVTSDEISAELRQFEY